MDLVKVIEAAYVDAPCQHDWLDGILDAGRPHLDCGFGVVAWTFDARDPTNLAILDRRLDRDDPELWDLYDRASSGLSFSADDPRAKAHMRPFCTLSSVVGVERLAGGAAFKDVLHPIGARDMIGAIGTDPTGCGVGIGALVRKEFSPTTAEVRRWSRVAAHLAAGFRLRRASSGDGDAVLEPAGKVAHAEGEAKTAAAREALSRAAIAVDRARGKLRRQDNDEAIEVWRGLVAGRWSLVERFESDGRRYLIARPNDPRVDLLPMLTERERQVLMFRAFGHSQKLISYELGLSASVVSRSLALAMKKLGIRSPADLMAMLAPPRPA